MERKMTAFPNRGFYRGNIDQLLDDALKAFDALPPDKQAEMREAQKLSYVRGELAFGNDRQEAEYRGKVLQPPTRREEVRSEISEALASSSQETRREIARASGYTGDTCSNCQGIRMKVSGHCTVCEDCGTTTGCS